MIQNASGIVLRKRRLTETSLIIHWISPTAGRVATVAKGALRPNSSFRGKLDLFYEADFNFMRSARSDLHNLREVVVRNFHEGLRHDLTYLEQASYAAELIEVSTETDTPLEEIYELFKRWLAELPSKKPKPETVLRFEVRLLALLGLQPDSSATTLTPGAKAVLRAWDLDWESGNRVHLSPSQVKELSRFLRGFLVYHLGKVPREREAALKGV